MVGATSGRGSATARRISITDEVAAGLGSYVYVYIDPRDGKPFYIGKGKGARLFSHLDDRSESRKVARIDELRSLGLEPRIDLLRYGMTDTEAALVEAAAIDLIGKSDLTNVMSGYDGRTFGRIHADEVIVMLTAKPVVVREPAPSSRSTGSTAVT